MQSALLQLAAAVSAALLARLLPPPGGLLLFVAYLMAYSYWAGRRDARRSPR